jgi:hypothetical protein
MDLLEGGAGSSVETCVIFSSNGTEEVSTKVQEAVDIKEENVSEVTPFPSIKTETEVRVCDGSS